MAILGAQQTLFPFSQQTLRKRDVLRPTSNSNFITSSSFPEEGQEEEGSSLSDIEVESDLNTGRNNYSGFPSTSSSQEDKLGGIDDLIDCGGSDCTFEEETGAGEQDPFDMMALVSKSSMENTSNLPGFPGFMKTKFGFGGSSTGGAAAATVATGSTAADVGSGAGTSMGVEDELGLKLSIGALERRLGKEMPMSEDLGWDNVDDLLANVSAGPPSEDDSTREGDVLESRIKDVQTENDDGDDDVVTSSIRRDEDVQVDNKGEIVVASQEVGQIKDEDDMEVEIKKESSMETTDVPLPPSSSLHAATATAIVSADKQLQSSNVPSLQHTSSMRGAATIAARPAAKLEPSSPVSNGKKISLKEKRALEAKMFPEELLQSLDGTTSAEVRKMNTAERDLVLFKRKLRNRESARRSRIKRQATLAELQDEVDTITDYVEKIVISAIGLKRDNDRLNRQLEVANAELRAWRSVYPEGNPMSQPVKVGG